MNLLITGVTGFIGSNLAVNLIEKGYNVYGLVRHTSRKNLEPLRPVLDRIRFVKGNLTTYHSIDAVVEATQPQFVLHLGALTPVRLSFENPYPYISTNFKGTVNIVHAILENAPKAVLLYASTAEVYGWQKDSQPIKETAPLNPASPYAVTKEAADQYVRMAMKIYGLKAAILRPNNTYGRKERGFLTEYLIHSMLGDETCYVGAPDSIRDYMFVSDHVQAYRLAMESEKALGKVFNVSPGNPVTNKELAEMVKEATEYKGTIVYGSYPPGYPERPAQCDPRYLVLDNTKIRSVLRWKPTVTLEEGLERTVKMCKASI